MSRKYTRNQLFLRQFLNSFAQIKAQLLPRKEVPQIVYI